MTSVEAVSGVNKPRRDKQRNPHSDLGQKGAEGLFAKILEESAGETTKEVVDYSTTTYGRDSKMKNFHYRTREYHG